MKLPDGMTIEDVMRCTPEIRDRMLAKTPALINAMRSHYELLKSKGHVVAGQMPFVFGLTDDPELWGNFEIRSDGAFVLTFPAWMKPHIERCIIETTASN